MITAPDTSPPIEEQNSAISSKRHQESGQQSDEPTNPFGKSRESYRVWDSWNVQLGGGGAGLLHAPLVKISGLGLFPKDPQEGGEEYSSQTVATHSNNPVFGRHGFLEPVTTWRRTHHKRPGQERASILKGFWMCQHLWYHNQQKNMNNQWQRVLLWVLGSQALYSIDAIKTLVATWKKAHQKCYWTTWNQCDHIVEQYGLWPTASFTRPRSTLGESDLGFSQARISFVLINMLSHLDFDPKTWCATVQL